MDLVRELVGGELAGTTVVALGAAFKPNSDDIRDAPALDVASTLHREGARVTVFDPVAMDNARRVHPELEYGTDVLQAAAGADVVVLLTEWAQFREIDPEVMGSLTSSPS
ncbi:UDP binding domain-containing protein [Streptomyces sp. NPDC005917]|uniref:UDP binding domain-containing protein n=1 Tax=unclassified Streptomyces TaxID=2593676 RepID=UPI0033D66D13